MALFWFATLLPHVRLSPVRLFHMVVAAQILFAFAEQRMSQPREQYRLSIMDEAPTSLDDWMYQGGPVFYVSFSHAFFLVATTRWNHHLRRHELHCLPPRGGSLQHPTKT